MRKKLPDTQKYALLVYMKRNIHNLRNEERYKSSELNELMRVRSN